jgi:hypothetical protein
MGKAVVDAVYDAALNEVINNADQAVVCTTEPADYTAATTDEGSGGVALGEVSISSTNFTGPADGDTSGRKLTLDSLSGVGVDVTGVAGHVALVDDGNSRLLMVDTYEETDVVGVDTGTDTITIDGDHTADIETDDYIRISGSTGNDGAYTVSSVSLNGSDTDVVVNESVSDSTADGICIYGAQHLSSGNSTDINGFDFEILDPT